MPHKVSKLRLPEPTVLAAYPYYLQEICSESVQNHDSENPDLLPGFSFFAEICLQKFAVLLRLVSGTLILTCRFWYADSRRAGFPCAGLGRGVWFVPFHVRAAAYSFRGISARHKNNNGVRDHRPKAAPQWKCSVSGEAGFQKRPEFPDTAAIQPKPCGTFGVLSDSHFYGYLSAETEKVRLQRKTGQVFFEPADRSLFEKFGSFRCI